MRVRVPHVGAGPCHDQAGGDCGQQLGVNRATRGAPQRRHAQPCELLVAQKEAEHVEQVGDAVVYGGRRHEQHARADDELGERPIAVGSGVSEAVGFVDDEQAVRGGRAC